MNGSKLTNEFVCKKSKSFKDEKNEFLDNFSRRSRNALAAFEILDKSRLEDSIETGELFKVPRLGLNGLREIITWAWRNKK